MDCRDWHPERWGTYRRHEMGWRRQQGGFNLYPLVDDHPGFMTPSGLIEIWSIVCEAYLGDEDKFPVYREPTNSPVTTPEYFDAGMVDQIDASKLLNDDYPASLQEHADATFLMTTGARQPVYFHSEHRQLPWCRELWPVPRVEINPKDALELGIEQGDWVWIETERGKVRQVADQLRASVVAARVPRRDEGFRPHQHQLPGEQGHARSSVRIFVRARLQREGVQSHARELAVRQSRAVRRRRDRDDHVAR